MVFEKKKKNEPKPVTSCLLHYSHVFHKCNLAFRKAQQFLETRCGLVLCQELRCGARMKLGRPLETSASEPGTLGLPHGASTRCHRKDCLFRPYGRLEVQRSHTVAQIQLRYLNQARHAGVGLGLWRCLMTLQCRHTRTARFIKRLSRPGQQQFPE